MDQMIAQKGTIEFASPDMSPMEMCRKLREVGIFMISCDFTRPISGQSRTGMGEGKISYKATHGELGHGGMIEGMHKYIIVANSKAQTGTSLDMFQAFCGDVGAEEYVRKEAELQGISVKRVFGPGSEARRAAYALSFHGAVVPYVDEETECPKY